jgi:hypothetical protein
MMARLWLTQLYRLYSMICQALLQHLFRLWLTMRPPRLDALFDLSSRVVDLW